MIEIISGRSFTIDKFELPHIIMQVTLFFLNYIFFAVCMQAHLTHF